MAELLKTNVKVASVVRTAPVIAEAGPRNPRPASAAVASAVPVPVPAPARAAVVADERLPLPPMREVAEADIEPEAMTRGIDLPMPSSRRPHAEEGSSDPIKPIIVRTVAVKRGNAKTASAATSERAPERAFQRNVATRGGGWVIQVGAFPGEDEAKSRLKTVQGVARSVLASAEPFTERVVKREATLYRARFAGLDKDGAQAACRYLKRNDIACLALKN
jgi:D-alanyl-D-alanine carboxypeptidase